MSGKEQGIADKLRSDSLEVSISFSVALESLKAGAAIQRQCWHEDKWIRLCNNWNGHVNPSGEQFQLQPFIYIHTETADIIPWSPSQDDLLATDWFVKSMPLLGGDDQFPADSTLS